MLGLGNGNVGLIDFKQLHNLLYYFISVVVSGWNSAISVFNDKLTFLVVLSVFSCLIQKPFQLC